MRRKPRTIEAPPAEVPYEYRASADDDTALRKPADEASNPQVDESSTSAMQALPPVDEHHHLADDDVEAHLEAITSRLEERAVALRYRSDVGPHSSDHMPEGDVLYQQWRETREVVLHDATAHAIAQAKADEIAARADLKMAIDLMVYELVALELPDRAVDASIARAEAAQAAYDAAVEQKLHDEIAERAARRCEEEARMERSKEEARAAYFASADPFISKIRQDAETRIAAEREAERDADEELIAALSAKLSKYERKEDEESDPDCAPSSGAAGAAEDETHLVPKDSDVDDKEVARLEARLQRFGIRSDEAKPQPSVDVVSSDAAERGASCDVAQEAHPDDAAHADRQEALAAVRSSVVNQCVSMATTSHYVKLEDAGARRDAAAHARMQQRMKAIEEEEAAKVEAAKAAHAAQETGVAITFGGTTRSAPGTTMARKEAVTPSSLPPATRHRKDDFITTATID